MADKEIEVPILVRTPGTPDGSLSGISRYAQVFGRAFGAIKSHPWVLAAFALYHSLTEVVFRFKEHEAAVNSLRQAMLQQGIYSGNLSQTYREMALAFQKISAFSEDEITRAQAETQAYLGEIPITKELMQAILDFAAGTGKSLDAAAEAVAKSIGTNVNALSRYGVTLDDSMSRQERLAAVVHGLEGRWRGQAEAQTKGLGALIVLQNSLKTLSRTIGERFAPYVTFAAVQAKELAEGLSKSAAFLDGISYVFEHVTIGVSFLKTTLAVIGSSLSTIFQSGFSAMTKVMEGNIVGAMDSYRQGISQARENAKRRYLEFVTEGEAILTERRERRQEQADRELQMLEQAQLSRRTVGDRKKTELDNIFRIRDEKAALEAITIQRLKNDRRFKIIHQRMNAAETETARLKIELEKRRLWDEEFRRTQMEYSEKKTYFLPLIAQEKMGTERKVFESLAELKDSKLAPLVVVGKGAAITLIGANTAIAIETTMTNLAMIPPPVGEILGVAMSSALALYGAEQIENIIDSDIDKPGRIGMGLSFSIDAVKALIEGALEVMANGKEAIAKFVGDKIKGIVGGEVGEQIGELIKESEELERLITQGVAYEVVKSILKGNIGEISEKFGRAMNLLAGGIMARASHLVGAGLHVAADFLRSAVGLVAGAISSLLPGPLGDAFKAIGDFVGGAVGWVADLMGDIANAIGDVIGAIGDAIGDAVDAIGDFLGLAHGGVVSHAGESTVVTPLHRSGLRLHTKVNVKIQGGLVPSPGEAQRIAGLIAQEMRKHG